MLSLFFALIGAGGVALSLMDWVGLRSQNLFYLYLFFLHLVLGLIFLVPSLVFFVLHWNQMRHRLHPSVKHAGYGLAFFMLTVFVSGLALTRVEWRGFSLFVNHPQLRCL